MGTVKEHLIEIETRGFNDIRKYICADCVEDEFLKKWIIDNSTKTETCDYCGEEQPVVFMNDLMNNLIMNYIFNIYENVDDSYMGYDSEDGEYFGNTYDKDDIISDIADSISNNTEVIEDIKEAILDITFCKNDPYSLDDNQRYRYSWDDFTKLVKYKTRYFFLTSKRKNFSEILMPIEILSIIAEKTKNLGLIKIIPTNTDFFRARIYNKNTEKIYDGCHLGSPPEECAQNGRMNARGISCFYASDDKEISKKEILNEDLKPNEELVIAKFKNLRDLKILDLTAISRLDMPSIFDLENYDNRETILFLRALNNELIRPIENLQDIEYVPTQIFAEYFKLEEKLDGIKYNSSKDNNGICYVLFFNNEQCIDDDSKELWQDRCVLKLMGYEIINKN